MNTAQAAQKAITAILASRAKRATVYLSEKEVVSVCCRFKWRSHARRSDFVLKIGQPNYLERRFIHACKAAREPLPVRKVQLRDWPVKRGG
jgi:hypothetical protein